MPVSLPMRERADDAKRRRLDSFLAGRDPVALGLSGLAEDAELVGSLALAGIEVEWDVVRASRGGSDLSGPAAALRRAQGLLPPRALLNRSHLKALCLAVADDGSLRRVALARADGPPAAAPDRIEARLAALGDWFGADSISALVPAAAGALALVRLVEIAPLERGNGRLSRLAAAHVMSSRGAPRPILVAADSERLAAALSAAFRMDTTPLVALLEEASSRALDVMLQALERGLV